MFKPFSFTVLSLLVFVSLITGPGLIVGAQSEPIVSGDTVYISDQNVFLAVTPHTIRSSQWINITLESKQYSGPVDFCFGFPSQFAKPTKLELYKPRIVVYDRVFEGEQYLFNPNYEVWYNFTAEDGAWIWNGFLNISEKIIVDPCTNISRVEYYPIFEGWFNRINKNSYRVFYQESILEPWLNLKGVLDWNVINYNFQNMDRWVLSSGTVQQNVNYTMRFWLELKGEPFNIKRKYSLGFKPSGETLQEAIGNGHFYYLDPWFDASYPVQIDDLEDNNSNLPMRKNVWETPNDWVFYFFRNASAQWYISTQDPSVGWGSATQITYYTQYYAGAVWYDDPYFYLMYADIGSGINKKVYFRRGTHSAGVISWGIERTVKDFGATSVNLQHNNIATSLKTGSDKRIWITVCRYISGGPYIYGFKSSSADGSGAWTQYTVFNRFQALYSGVLPKNTDGDMTFFGTRGGQRPYADSWNETAGAFSGDIEIHTETAYYWAYSYTSYEGVVYFCYQQFGQRYYYFLEQPSNSFSWLTSETIYDEVSGDNYFGLNVDTYGLNVGTISFWIATPSKIVYVARDPVTGWGSTTELYDRTGESTEKLDVGWKAIRTFYAICWKETTAPDQIMIGVFGAEGYYITFYLTDGGLFWVNKTNMVNATTTVYANQTVLEFACIPLNASWFFVNYTWTGDFSNDNPYDFTVGENMTVWLNMLDPPFGKPGEEAPGVNIPVLFGGFIFIMGLIAFTLYVSRKRNRGG